MNRIVRIRDRRQSRWDPIDHNIRLIMIESGFPYLTWLAGAAEIRIGVSG